MSLLPDDLNELPVNSLTILLLQQRGMPTAQLPNGATADDVINFLAGYAYNVKVVKNHDNDPLGTLTVANQEDLYNWINKYVNPPKSKNNYLLIGAGILAVILILNK